MTCRGRLKILLGYASRVGKSERMFDEGRRRRSRGQDVVIGAVQDAIPDLEVIPLCNGMVDVPAILRRAPQVCLIDALGNAQRWQQVEQLLAAGIHVVTAVNLQFISPGCVPEEFIHGADELVIVDATSGHTELRERALLLAAEVVEEQLNRCMEEHGLVRHWGTQERILVCLTARSNAKTMLNTAARVVQAFHGRLLAVHVGSGDDGALQENLGLARSMGAEVFELEAADAFGAILRLAREQPVTQLFIGHTQQPAWMFWKHSAVSRAIHEAEGMDVRLFPAA